MNHPPKGPFPIMVEGLPDVGETLLARPNAIKDEDGIDHDSFAFQWFASDDNGKSVIPGATGQSYVPTNADRGKYLSVMWTYTDLAGNEESVISDPLPTFVMGEDMMDIAGLYRLTLDREPDGPGLVYWTDLFHKLIARGVERRFAATRVVSEFGLSEDFEREMAAKGDV